MTYDRKSPPRPDFVAHRFLGREVFPHRVRAIAKQYPDTFLLLEGRGVPREELSAGQFCQINLYSDHRAGLPPDLFEDRQVNWHNQQFGQVGLIAAAGVYLREGSLVITVLQSDLCQQLHRYAGYRACKTQVEKRFGYWYRMLFNAVLDFAIECGASTVYSPTAAWILGATRRQIDPHLFGRVYDSPDRNYLCRRVPLDGGEYWELPVADNASRVVRLIPLPPDAPHHRRPQICVFHDTEENVDTRIDAATCRRALTSMLEIEKDRGVAATYTILGTLFRHKREEIWSSDERHALGFHSFNHLLVEGHQLERCREVDLQVRGYRPPRSVITQELTDYPLSYLNFEWLASGASSVNAREPWLRRGVVRIPIYTDDYPLVTAQMEYSEWEDLFVRKARYRPFIALGLHDCYAGAWLGSYAKLLDRLSEIGDLVTADTICDRLLWEQGSAVDLTSANAPPPAA